MTHVHFYFYFLYLYLWHTNSKPVQNLFGTRST